MQYPDQAGRQVLKVAVARRAEVWEGGRDRNGLEAADVEYLVPNQANQRSIDATAKRMGLSSDQVMMNIDRYGNTTAATIPLCLFDWEDELQRGDELILTAFGGGFTWGSGHLTWAYD